MISCFILNFLPLWFNYILVVLLIVLAIRSGMSFAKWRKKNYGIGDDSAINTLVGATLGLLAFILAFTFSLSSSRFDARKNFLLEEVNSIETTWLRAGLVANPFREKIQKELEEYTRIRVYLVSHPEDVKEIINKSQAIQSNIWSLITELTKTEDSNSVVNGLLISAVNDMFDFQTKRISKGLIDKIPTLIWAALFLLVIIAMFEVGYLLGKAGASNWAMVLALSMAFSAVIIIIVDLDSVTGFITINNQVLFDMYDRIKS
ncbi:hypothetical protein [uncultured Algibacter sp.]|uniref:bestrophin-like domain n=1 Tax=uncultured Algibacter sp. TaxID=298659 RepID=UPI00260B363D|nr:hypothetical protein [uncultured Algibacter sp.]